MSNNYAALRKIAHLTAVMCAGKDWHRMPISEKALVAELEKQGFIATKKHADGFVGHAINPPPQEEACCEDTHS